MTDDDHAALVAGQADMRSEIRELRAENELLRAQGVHLADALYAGQQDNERLRTENERLLQELRWEREPKPRVSPIALHGEGPCD